MSDLLVLHRYFIWANRMRALYSEALDKFLKQEGHITTDEKATKFFAGEPGIFLSYWYGGLYVVIEGWQELHFSDPDVDKFLTSPNVDLLKKYRNGVFHFQGDYFDDRFFNFFKQNKSADWAHELTKSLGEFFIRELSAKQP